MSVMTPRQNTPRRTETRPDGSTVTSMVIKRACNGCDRELGDAHPLEIQLAFLGKELPDARDECPDCTAADRTTEKSGHRP
jgi:hypothetical protein